MLKNRMEATEREETGKGGEVRGQRKETGARVKGQGEEGKGGQRSEINKEKGERRGIY